MWRHAWVLGFALVLAQPAPDGLEDRFKPPTGVRWGYIRNADGARLRYSHTPAREGKATASVVLMHGYSEFGEKYFEVMRELAAQGFEVWQMDWRGYGGSDRFLADHDKAHSLGVDRDTRDLEQFVSAIVKPATGRPLLLIGHSMGGHLAARYLHDYPGRFKAAVLCSPFLSLSPESAKGMPAWVVRSLLWSLSDLGMDENWAMGNGPWRDRLIEKLTHDPVRAQVQLRWTRSSPVLRIGGVTNGWVREYMRSFDVMSKPGYWAGIKAPVLMGSAGQDVLTRPDAHSTACSAMANCRLVSFSGAWHELFMESDPVRSKWMEAVFAFLGGQK